MTQPTTHPLDVANLLVPALSGVVGALADRGGSSVPEYDARAQESWRLIQSFRPRDSIDLMLAGQLVEFHEILADGTRDLLRGMTEPVKHRTRSGLVAIGRLCLSYADRLDKRGVEPHRTEAVVQAPEQAAPPAQKKAAAPPKVAAQPIAAASPKSATPRDHTPLVASPRTSEAPAADLAPRLAAVGTEAAAEPCIATAGVEGSAWPDPAPDLGPADVAASWVDAPHQEEMVETPAIAAARASMALQALAAAKAAVPASAPAKAPVTQLGAKGWYVDVGAPSMSADEVFPSLSNDAAKRERKGEAGGD